MLILLPMIGVIYIYNNLVHKIMMLYHFWGHNDLSKAENRKKRNTKIAVSQPFFELQHSNFAQTLFFIPTLILHSKMIKIRKKFLAIFRRPKTYHFWRATRPPPIVVWKWKLYGKLHKIKTRIYTFSLSDYLKWKKSYAK